MKGYITEKLLRRKKEDIPRKKAVSATVYVNAHICLKPNKSTKLFLETLHYISI